MPGRRFVFFRANGEVLCGLYDVGVAAGRWAFCVEHVADSAFQPLAASEAMRLAAGGELRRHVLGRKARKCLVVFCSSGSWPLGTHKWKEDGVYIAEEG